MYELGDQFKPDYSKALSNPESTVKGKKYRITIITESLLRIEYDDNGIFEDRPTELVWYRNHPKPAYNIKEDSKYLEIETKYFKLYYSKEKPFSGSKINPTQNLKIELKNSDRVWYYGHPEVRNYGTSAESLENKNKKLKKGLFSGDGFVSMEDSANKIIQENGEIINRESKEIDIYVFMYLKDFSECLKDYFMITGYPALIPRYALGNWWSRNIEYNDELLKKLVDDFKDKSIPISVLLLNKEWHNRSFHDKLVDSGFTYDNNKFKNPLAMAKYLHQNGIRLGLSINPIEGIYPYEEEYEKITEYLEANEGGVIPFNVYNPKFIDVYLKLLIHPLENKEVDFYWLDNEKIDSHIQWALNHYQFYDMSRNYKIRPMLLTNNSEIAEHRYPTLYSGKTDVGWETLKSIPLFTASAANKGVSFWAHDIGGFHNGIEDDELYTRFVQLGIFSPIFKFGADSGKYYKREPWRWGIKTYSIVKDYMTLRHRLIPYLYTESYKYHKYGTPLVQPLYYKNPDMYDDTIYKNEYFFGSELFICPIINQKEDVMNRVIHRFYLPEGTWYDFVTGKKFPGGKNYISFFKDEDYPVFAKSGAIIVLGNNENINDTTPPKNLEIQIFPGTNNTYNLYEDDGISDLYKKDYFLKTSIDYNYLPNNYTVIIRAIDGKSNIVPEQRNYKIRFRNTKKAPETVIYFNDTPIKNFKTYKEGTDFIVEVSDIKTIGQLTINCKGKDIEISAVRIVNEDLYSIISDLQIETKLKEAIDKILFDDTLTINKKRVQIRKLRRKGLGPQFIKLFLKLLEYIGQI
ncbi:MAG: glycoside hydrolase family 31 protein [Bacilli bacterium]|nr:glycoside hydrolase family 31 protein [Bacilli bacterium]